MKRICFFAALMSVLALSCSKEEAIESPAVRTYYEPEVTVTVTDSIPASGGSVDSAVVTYCQKCVTVCGRDTSVSYVTSGGNVSFGAPVTAESLGDTVSGKPMFAGVLTAAVTVNGKTGTGCGDVYQAVNSAVRLDVVVRESVLKIGDTTGFTAYTVYSSGLRKETPDIRYSVSSGDIITLSDSSRVVTANECSTSGSGAKLYAASGNLTGYAVIMVYPVCQYLEVSCSSSYRLQADAYKDTWQAKAYLVCKRTPKPPVANGPFQDVTAHRMLNWTYETKVADLYRQNGKGCLQTSRPGKSTVTFSLFGTEYKMTVLVTE